MSGHDICGIHDALENMAGGPGNGGCPCSRRPSGRKKAGGINGTGTSAARQADTNAYMDAVWDILHRSIHPDGYSRLKKIEGDLTRAGLDAKSGLAEWAGLLRMPDNPASMAAELAARLVGEETKMSRKYLEWTAYKVNTHTDYDSRQLEGSS